MSTALLFFPYSFVELPDYQLQHLIFKTPPLFLLGYWSLPRSRIYRALGGRKAYRFSECTLNFSECQPENEIMLSRLFDSQI
jgi:hypothetical protein